MIYPYLIIFFYSMILNTLPLVLTSFQRAFDISVGVSSFLPFASLIGTVVSNIFIGLYLGKIGLKRSFLTAFTFVSFGTLLVAISNNIYVTLFGLFFIGLSVGFSFTSATTLLAYLPKANFGFFHAAYGLGGVISPVILKLVGKYMFLYAIYFVFALLVLIYSSTRKFPRVEAIESRNILSVFKYPEFSIFLLFLTLYSSAEIGSITWSSNFMESFGKSTELMYVGFWAMFTLGRFLSGVFEKMSEKVLLNVLASSIFLILFVTFKVPIIFVVYGFIVGPIFPIVQLIATEKLSKDILPAFNGATYAFTTLGGSLTNLAMGFVADRSFEIAFLIPIIIYLTLSGLFYAKGK